MRCRARISIYGAPSGRALRQVWSISVGAAISRPLESSLIVFGRLIAAPTKYNRLRSRHQTYSLFTFHRSLFTKTKGQAFRFPGEKVHNFNTTPGEISAIMMPYRTAAVRPTGYIISCDPTDVRPPTGAASAKLRKGIRLCSSCLKPSQSAIGC